MNTKLAGQWPAKNVVIVRAFQFVKRQKLGGEVASHCAALKGG